MATDLVGFTVYVEPDFHERLKSLASGDGRTLSNFVARTLHQMHGPERKLSELMSLRSPQQVDITDAIAHVVKRGPAKPTKHK